MRISLPHDFEPRPYQKRAMAYFDRGGKRAISVWHRRGGKDITAANQTNKSAHQDIGPYWHFFPTFEQARRSIWEGFRKDGKRLLETVFPGFLNPGRAGSIVARKNESQMFIELKCGSIWRLMGTDRVENVGAGPKGVVFSEFALCRPTAWDYVRPMLRESGGWAWFITTPRGKNHAKKLFDSAGPDSGWFRDIQTVRDTGLQYSSNKDPDVLLDAEGMMDEERAEGMAEELIRQEYLCDFTAATLGSVYGDLLEKLEHRPGAFDEFEHGNDGIFTSWDLGFTDSTAIWFWRLGPSGVDVVDHYEAHGQPLSHFFDVLESKPYRYVRHWLPHDARARTLATGSSIQDQFVDRYGAQVSVEIGPSLSLLDGVQASRWLLQTPIRFHARCAEALEALRAYRYEYDEDRKTFGKKPEHDWSSHTADAFRYLAVVVKVTELVERKPTPTDERPLIRHVPAPKLRDPASYTLDELWETHRGQTKERL